MDLFTVNSVLTLLLIGVTFFVVAVLAMIWLFGWSTHKLLKQTPSLVILFVLSLAIPLTITGLSSQTQTTLSAHSSIKITNVELVKLDDHQHLLTFSTSQPTIGYVLYKDPASQQDLPALPTYSLTKRQDHAIILTSPVTPGQLWLVLDNRRYHLADYLTNQ